MPFVTYVCIKQEINIIFSKWINCYIIEFILYIWIKYFMKLVISSSDLICFIFFIAFDTDAILSFVICFHFWFINCLRLSINKETAKIQSKTLVTYCTYFVDRTITYLRHTHNSRVPGSDAFGWQKLEGARESVKKLGVKWRIYFVLELSPSKARVECRLIVLRSDAKSKWKCGWTEEFLDFAKVVFTHFSRFRYWYIFPRRAKWIKIV